MSRKAIFQPYQPGTILNRARRADHWFWTRYSAYPYTGCQHGCAFCYCREEKFCPYEDANAFSSLIKVKENAPELLHKALYHSKLDTVFTGDYQPAEKIFQLSRRMLEVCRDLSFPVFVLERSPLILRDLDVLKEIQERTHAVTTGFSIIYTSESQNAGSINALERLAPPPEKRFEAMKEIARSGILTGTCIMPILPGLSDDDRTLEQVVQRTAENGGKYVLAGELTLANQQREHFINALAKISPDHAQRFRNLNPDAYETDTPEHWLAVRRKIRYLCQGYGISDRIPRLVSRDDKLGFNKKIAEILANDSYRLELESKPGFQVWGYRKAAWAVEDLQQDIRRVYQAMGLKGLESIPGVEKTIAGRIESAILEKGLIKPILEQPIPS